MALSCPGGQAHVVEGVCEGVIGLALCGEGGFGYDPLFIPEGYNQTFAELSAEEKNRISHRGLAQKQAATVWGDLLAELPDDWPKR
jgi:XTP/dITP diphosphohydrolase